MTAPLTDRYAVTHRLYPYRRSADQDAAEPARHPVVVVGGGPVGLVTALDLGLKGHRVVLLDDHEGVGTGSRAICFSKRTLEICHRLGAGEQMLDKGVVWSRGRVFHDRDEIYAFDLLPEAGHRHPAFINLSQIDFERFLAEAIARANAEGAQIELRGRNRVDAVDPRADGVSFDVMTPEGPYQMEADWLIACDGARSPVRDMLGLGFEGRVFEDNFLIADVRMTADFPTERWFWFEPWFKSGASALLHKQPDDIWRIDFQLGWDIDREEELKEDNVRARVDAMLGPDVAYKLDWTSIYTFQCRRMDAFVQGRVVFAGDSAHQVSPFGARGANSGVQDAENLAWRLDLILRGVAGETLMQGYNRERVMAADENILNSTRATDFLTPKSAVSRTFRDAVLHLASDHAFARPLVNSGRLSVPCVYGRLPGFGADALEGGPDRSRPGAPCPDAPRGEGYLLDGIGDGFQLLGINAFVPDAFDLDGIAVTGLQLEADADIKARYLGVADHAVYLIRPDQHVVARWPVYSAEAVIAAIRAHLGR
ncbi:FAD-dependent oxidoreductase [Roseobacter sinensis]|uniref:FAD-dependent oxidoreductase n=1 Tax=Roseobacter sinensis TaxID=2931391 RepID=A0ABT3BKU4_9RHOB|nr:FAD-dependent oxidoreductase [Roseobacter sp. WL0113]MCV3273848.1 FAD-dependent oxidoreductase [Roseobacter sp. WL0113]